MTRDEAADRIARGSIKWGHQRDLTIRDKRGQILEGDREYQVMLAWAKDLPESTFRQYAKEYAQQKDDEEWGEDSATQVLERGPR